MKKRYIKSNEEFVHIVFDRINNNMKEAGSLVDGAISYKFTSNEDLLKFIKYFGYLTKEQIVLWLYDYASEDFSEVEIFKNIYYKFDQDKYYFDWIKPVLGKLEGKKETWLKQYQTSVLEHDLSWIKKK